MTEGAEGRTERRDAQGESGDSRPTLHPKNYGEGGGGGSPVFGRRGSEICHNKMPDFTKKDNNRGSLSGRVRVWQRQSSALLLPHRLLKRLERKAGGGD